MAASKQPVIAIEAKLLMPEFPNNEKVSNFIKPIKQPRKSKNDKISTA